MAKSKDQFSKKEAKARFIAAIKGARLVPAKDTAKNKGESRATKHKRGGKYS